MQRKGFAACDNLMRCKSREVAFFLPGSQCDAFNMAQEKKVTNGDRLRSMADDELAEFLCGRIECDPDTCPGYETCKITAGKGNGILKWLRMPAKEDTNGNV